MLKNKTEGNNSPLISGNSAPVTYTQKGDIIVGEVTSIGKEFIKCSDEELLDEAKWIKSALKKEYLDKRNNVKSELKIRFFISLVVIIFLGIYFLITKESLFDITMFCISAFSLLFTASPIKQVWELNDTEQQYKENLKYIVNILKYRQRKDLIKEINRER